MFAALAYSTCKIFTLYFRAAILIISIYFVAHRFFLIKYVFAENRVQSVIPFVCENSIQRGPKNIKFIRI